MAGVAFNIDIVYNPGNALTGLNQLNSVMLQSRTAAQAFAAGFAGIGGGLTNFEAPINRAGTAIQLYKAEVTSIVPVNTQAAASINRLVTTFTSAGQAISGSARLMTPFNAAMVQTGNIVQQTATKFSAGLAPSVAAVGGPLNNLNSQLGTASSGLSNLGNSANQSTTFLGRLREMFSGNRGLVFGLSALFGTITGIVFEFQLMTDASKQVAESQAVVNDLVAQGQQGTGKYQQALQALGKDQRFLEFSTRNMALAFTNLIPDVLLIINGIIQLTDKMKSVGSGATAVTSSMQAVTTSMQAATTATTELGVAQTVLGNGLTTSGNSFKAIVPILSQAGQGMIGVGTSGTAAVGGLTAVNTATTGLKTGLAATVTSAGTAITSMGQLGLIARTSATPLGTLGVAGRTAATELELVAAAGLSTKSALLGAIAAPIALGAAFVAMGLILKNLSDIFTEVKNSQVPMIAIEEEAIVAAYKWGAAHETAAQQAETAISNLADNLTSQYESMVAGAEGFASDIVTALTPGAPGALKESQIKKPEIAPTQGGGGGTSTATGGGGGDILGNIGKGISDWASRVGSLFQPNKVGTGPQIAPKLEPQGPPKPPGLGQQPPVAEKPLTDLEIIERARQQSTKNASQLLTEVSKPGALFGNFPKNQQLDLPTFEKALDIVNKLKDEEGKLNAVDRSKYIRDLNQIITGTDQEAKGKTVAAQAEKEFQSKIKEAETDLHTYNDTVGKMPRALQDATGMHQKLNDVVEIGGKLVPIEDQKLKEHIVTIGTQAAAYTSSNAIIGQSLAVREQIVAVGNEIIGGAEKEADAIQGVNIFWNDMNTTMADSLLANQQLSISSVDVTRSLTNQTEHQFLVNEGLLSGAQAAQEFLQKSIVGAAANDAYAAGIEKIAAQMGILPKNITLTAAELETLIDDFNQTGSTAASLAAVLATRLAPAFELFGKAFTADTMKEMSKAMKDLPGFDDLSKSVRKSMLEIGGEFQKVHQRALEFNTDVQTLVIGAFAGADKFSGSQLHSTFESLVKDFDSISKINPNVKQFDPLMEFLGNLSGTELRAGIMKLSPLLNDLSVAMQDPSSTAETFNAIIVKHAQLLADLGIKLDPLPSKYDATANSISNLQLQLSAFKPDKGFMTALDLISGKVTQIPKVDLSKEEKKEMKELKKEHKGERGAGEGGLGGPFSGDIPGVTTPPSTPPPGSIESRFGKISEATKKIDQPPAPDIKPFQAAQAAITTILVNITKVVGTMVTNVIKEFSTMGVGATKVVGTMVTSVAKEISSLSASVMKQVSTTVVTVIAAFSAMAVGAMKQTEILVVTTVKSFSQMAIGVFKQLQIMITKVIEFGTQLMNGWLVSIAAMGVDTITAFEIMSKGVQTSVSNLYTAVTAIAKQLDTDVVASITDMADTSLEVVVAFQDNIVTAMAEMADTSVEIVVNMDNNVVDAIEDMAKRGGDAAASFASDMESSMGKVETACNNAASAVSNLADEVAALDGSSAVVTVTTHFKTTGDPNPGGGSKAGQKAGDMLGRVISAASAKSFQFGGSIETSHGPQMAIFGDNPGGQETVAFIPHDNPFPTLRKLEKLFKGRSSSDIVSRALDRAEEMWIDLHLQIDNIMDGEKVSRQIIRKTFKKMRTRP